MHPIDRTHGRGLAAYRLPLDSGIYPPGVGRCGDRAPSLVDMRPLHVCALPAGHAGWHRSDEGAEWTLRDGEPRSDLPEGQQSRGSRPPDFVDLAKVAQALLALDRASWDQASREVGDLYMSRASTVVSVLDLADRDARVRAAVAEEIAAEANRRGEALPFSQFEARDALFELAEDINAGRIPAPAERSVGSPTPEVGTQGSDEHFCHRCGGPNVTWSAPSPLWNAVMRGGSINGDEIHDGIVCPPCFAQLAEEGGIASIWRFYAERVPVRLETVTPSGRTWDEQAWRWTEPADPSLPETQEGDTE